MTTKLERNGKLELIERLGLTQRRIDQLIEAGVLIEGHDGNFDVDWNSRRYRAYRDTDRDYVAAELNAAGDALNDGLRKLRAEPGVAKRRKIAERDRIGAQIGKMDAAYRLGNAMAPDGHRKVLNVVTNLAVGEAISEYFSLLGMSISDDVSVRGGRNTKA